MYKILLKYNWLLMRSVVKSVKNDWLNIENNTIYVHQTDPPHTIYSGVKQKNKYF